MSEWQKIGREKKQNEYNCLKCGAIITISNFWCPNCGAIHLLTWVKFFPTVFYIGGGVLVFLYYLKQHFFEK